MRIATDIFLALLSVLVISQAKNLKAFDLLSGGTDGLEIFPVTNPMGIFSGGSVTLELRLKGKPIGGKIISLIRKIDGPG